MKVEHVNGPGSPEDLPRMTGGSAVIGDQRNDENVFSRGFMPPFSASTIARSTS